MILNLNCFYSKSAKKRNSHGHFKCIKKHKSLPRNCCFIVITLCSPQKKLFSTEMHKCSTVIFCTQMTPYFVQKVVLNEKIITGVNMYRNFFTQMLIFQTIPGGVGHTWYLSFFLHWQNFWRIKFTQKNANFSR